MEIQKTNSSACYPQVFLPCVTQAPFSRRRAKKNFADHPSVPFSEFIASNSSVRKGIKSLGHFPYFLANNHVNERHGCFLFRQHHCLWQKKIKSSSHLARRKSPSSPISPAVHLFRNVICNVSSDTIGGRRTIHRGLSIVDHLLFFPRASDWLECSYRDLQFFTLRNWESKTPSKQTGGDKSARKLKAALRREKRWPSISWEFHLQINNEITKWEVLKNKKKTQGKKPPSVLGQQT